MLGKGCFELLGEVSSLLKGAGRLSLLQFLSLVHCYFPLLFRDSILNIVLSEYGLCFCFAIVEVIPSFRWKGPVRY